jgi:uncharacterized protein YjbI with pentapeptide repeats
LSKDSQDTISKTSQGIFPALQAALRHAIASVKIVASSARGKQISERESILPEVTLVPQGEYGHDSPSVANCKESIPLIANASATGIPDLKPVQDAVADAAGAAGTLWLSYVLTFFYLAVAAGGVTQRDLLFENRVKLPFLNVDLPLVGFFAVAPAIFLMVHAYTLVTFGILGNKISAFQAELQVAVYDDNDRAKRSRQLPSNLFVQLLAGPPEIKSGIVGWSLRVIAHITLVAGPVGLLILFQLQFLPYQSEVVTWLQRTTILADVLTLWSLWPFFLNGRLPKFRWSAIKKGTLLFYLTESLVALAFAFTIATFPGEWLEDRLPRLQVIPWRDGNPDPWRRTSLHEIFVEGNIDQSTQRPVSFWSNRLVLPNIDVIDHAKYDTEAKLVTATETFSLRGRHLEGAILFNAKLRKVDFTAADLRGARLSQSDLRGAIFNCAVKFGATKSVGFDQKCAHLEGADLSGAQLEDVWLDGAQLQGANIIDAALQGATLDDANLQGAWLISTNLQGASLKHTDLRGATLEGADLGGATLKGTQLQGTELRNAQVQSASFRGIFAWRADGREMNSEDTSVSQLKLAEGQACENSTDGICGFSGESFLSLNRQLSMAVPEGDRRIQALKGMQRLDPRSPLNGEKAMADAWAALDSDSPPDDIFENRQAQSWLRTACDIKGAPYSWLGIANALWGSLPFDGTLSPRKSRLVGSLLDQKHCRGAHGLPESSLDSLEEIREQ